MSSVRQKVAPVRPYNRFMSERKQNTGIDPAANFTRFIMRENSIDVYRPDRVGTLPRSQTVTAGKVPIGTTKCTFKMGLSSEAKLDRNALGIESQSFPKNPTDVIS